MGDWTVREDVRYMFIMGNADASFEDSKPQHNEFMTVTGSVIGPELGIGSAIGNVTDGPVMMIKSCIGNRALGWDLLPPGSEQFEYTDNNKVMKLLAFSGGKGIVTVAASL